MKFADDTLAHHSISGSDTSVALVNSLPLSLVLPLLVLLLLLLLLLLPLAESPRCHNHNFGSSYLAPMLLLATKKFHQSVAVSQLPGHALRVCESFDEALAKSLPLTMLPNYEISPLGDEMGDFLVVDLGGSTLRVAVISIAPPPPPPPLSNLNSDLPLPQNSRESRESRESRISIVISRSWTVENLFKVVNRDFFAWIGGKVAETLAAQNVVLPQSLITTGITWSFPLESTSYNTANIFHMAKGYVVDLEIVGSELKHLLESTMLENHQIRLDVQSIINDSLAVFSASRFLDQTTLLAMVLGTGLNFCCQLLASPKIALQKLLHDEKYVLFNTETSLFGHVLIPAFATKYDCHIDARFSEMPLFLPHMAVDPATNAIFQPFELLTSGRYLPELARLVIIEAMANGELFAAQKNMDVVQQPYQGFSGELMCFIAECSDDYVVAERIEAFFQWEPRLVSLADVANIRSLVLSIIRRAAFIVAVAIVAYVQLLARHNGAFQSPVISIGYVGSVMEYFSSLRLAVLEFVNRCSSVVELGVQVKLEPINESSLVGTAIAAASQCARSR